MVYAKLLFSMIFVKCTPYYIFDDRMYCVCRRQLSKIAVSALYRPSSAY